MLIIRNYCIQLFLLVNFQVFCVKGVDQVLMIALPEGILHVLLSVVGLWDEKYLKFVNSLNFLDFDTIESILHKVTSDGIGCIFKFSNYVF